MIGKDFMNKTNITCFPICRGRNWYILSYNMTLHYIRVTAILEIVVVTSAYSCNLTW